MSVPFADASEPDAELLALIEHHEHGLTGALALWWHQMQMQMQLQMGYGVKIRQERRRMFNVANGRYRGKRGEERRHVQRDREEYILHTNSLSTR